MQIIAQWTGRHADMLRQSLFMGNEGFAEYLGVSARTVANWRKFPEMVPQPEKQQILDVALDKASDRAKVRFTAHVGEMGNSPPVADPAPLSAVAMAASLDEFLPDPDERARVHGVLHKPSRLDVATVANLDQVLYGQRHAEDSIGPSMLIDPMKAQLGTLVAALRGASGPDKSALLDLVANWTTFVGWLHTALKEYSDADSAFATAEEMADELGDGTLASLATSYRGYLALLQGRYRAAIRASAASIGTPGAHVAQVTYATLQFAQSYAGIGDVREARELLHRASDMVESVGEPPKMLYWYTEPFLRMNIGMTQHSIGEYRDAADSILSGISDLPANQRNAEWVNDYRSTLSDSAGPE